MKFKSSTHIENHGTIELIGNCIRYQEPNYVFEFKIKDMKNIDVGLKTKLLRICIILNNIDIFLFILDSSLNYKNELEYLSLYIIELCIVYGRNEMLKNTLLEVSVSTCITTILIKTLKENYLEASKILLKNYKCEFEKDSLIKIIEIISILDVLNQNIFTDLLIKAIINHRHYRIGFDKYKQTSKYRTLITKYLNILFIYACNFGLCYMVDICVHKYNVYPHIKYDLGIVKALTLRKRDIVLLLLNSPKFKISMELYDFIKLIPMNQEYMKCIEERRKNSIILYSFNLHFEAMNYVHLGICNEIYIIKR